MTRLKLGNALVALAAISMGAVAHYIYRKRKAASNDSASPKENARKRPSERTSPDHTKRTRTREQKQEQTHVPLEKDAVAKKAEEKAAAIKETLPSDGPAKEGPQEQHAVAESMLKSSQDNSGPFKGQSKSSSNTGDISALLASKYAVPESDQADPVKLGKHYSDMAKKFKDNGLNQKAVADGRKWFNVSDGKAEPKAYMSFDTPLARGAVRLGTFRLDDKSSDSLMTGVSKAVDTILDTFPQGSVFHKNDKEHYHVTVQMISHPSDPRPNAFVQGGGINKDHKLQWIPAPSPSSLKKETELYQEIASHYGTPSLEVHSIAFTESGVLLLLFTDSSGNLQKLRSELKAAFPGANERQPSILHVTLARLMTEDQIGSEQRQKIARSCTEQTEKLKGKKFSPSALWYAFRRGFQ